MWLEWGTVTSMKNVPFSAFHKLKTHINIEETATTTVFLAPQFRWRKKIRSLKMYTPDSKNSFKKQNLKITRIGKQNGQLNPSWLNA